jgi:hypothetical protein
MKARLFRLLFLALVLGVFAIANLPPVMAPLKMANDKVQHAAAFAALALVAQLAFPSMRLLWVFVGLLAFNTLIEVSQGMFGFGRQTDLLDWVVGALASAGTLVVVGAWRLIPRVSER